MEFSVARVCLLDAPYHIDKLYDYYIPQELRGVLTVGGFVAVPFGSGNRKQIALIRELAYNSEYTNLKPILAPVCGSIVLSEEMIGLCLYMKEHFLCTVGDAVKAILPSAAFTKVKEYYTVTSSVPSFSNQREEQIYRYIESRGKTDIQALIKDNGSSSQRLLTKLREQGYITLDAEYTESRSPVSESAEICGEYAGMTEDQLLSDVKGIKQKDALKALYLTGRCTVSELRDRYGITRETVRSLEKRGIIKITKREIYRDPYSRKKYPAVPPLELSDEQTRARDEILSLVRSGEPKAALLYGVTGSGKTSVIRSVMDEVISEGKQVIMLVPEISLTPQTVDIFRACYGDRIAVIHSGLSKGERFDSWKRMERGEADICIGTRSAIFAPMKNIGLIVLDEEQEHTYKSDMDPKYHARDIARYRCAKHNATMLLASATPSLESYKKAKEGKYSLVTLTSRYGNAALPETLITDRRPDAKSGNMSPIGNELYVHIKRVLENKEQAILFINQRGYNRFLSCPLCGEVLTCRNCSISYTYHTVKDSDRGYLYCHYCGSKEAVPSKCPKCGNDILKRVGFGTQYVEEELHRLFPEANIMRMDADTTSTKFAYEELLGRFRNGEADILIGTQMVTKGHDFPRVTLVGVINADTSLYLSDYKSNERTFDLLTQVVGRAGRADKKGMALIQTYNPEHPILKLSSEQNYDKMYQQEIALRRSLVFPPFCDMVLFLLECESENELMCASKEFACRLEKIRSEEYSSLPIVVFGPMEAPIYKAGGDYRMRVIVKCKLSPGTRSFISKVYSEMSRDLNKKVRLSVDVNPTNL